MDHVTSNALELTILMPCLNEEKTVGACVREALSYLERCRCRGEVLVIDNGSTDASADAAKKAGARVVRCEKRGYGSALRCGIREARGVYVIFGDCDLSYDFRYLDRMHGMLRGGYDMVIGDRFAVPPVKEAMPFSHRLGVPALSLVGRIRYGCDVRDFHCGLRGFRKAAVEQLSLTADGMEFATELIGKASLAHLRLGQTPVTLRPDGREGRSHLRTFRDGWRHLRFMLFS